MSAAAWSGSATGATASAPPILLIGHHDTVFPPGHFEGWRDGGDGRAVGDQPQCGVPDDGGRRPRAGQSFDIGRQFGASASWASKTAQRLGLTARKTDTGAVPHHLLISLYRDQGLSLQATTKVQEMGQRSQEVSRIVATIEDIAAQTNLLALNAQIEAARPWAQHRPPLDAPAGVAA